MFLIGFIFFLSIVALIACIGALIAPLSTVGNRIKKIAKKSIFPIVIIFSSTFIINNCFFYAKPGYQYFITYPWGTVSAVTEPGYAFAPFAETSAWNKYIEVKADKFDEDSDDNIKFMDLVPIRFNDQVTAKARLSTRFQLPNDKESFVKLVTSFRTLDNLVKTTLSPTIKEVTINTGYMFAAQDYISGSASDFRTSIDDQLKNGSYSVEKKELKISIDSTLQNNARKIDRVRNRYIIQKRLDSNGKEIRVDNEVTKNGIIVSQVIVEEIILEEKFKTRLEAQRDESAKRQLEQQKIKTAKDAQNRIIAEGERDKAAERVSQEKEQVKALISIETKLKQEETNKALAKIALETEKLKAKAEKVKADAEAYKNAKLVASGLTPQEKAQIQKETAIGVAAELAKIKFPNTMIMGGNDKGGTPLESLIGAAMAKQLNGK